MFGGQTKPLSLLLIILMALCTCKVEGICNKTDTVLGCVNCDGVNESLVLNVSSYIQLCSGTLNCLIIDSSGSCIECRNGKTLNITTGGSDCLATINGCKTAVNSSCIECYSTNYFLDTVSGQCSLVIIDYCWQANLTQCLECSDQNILVKSSCKVPSASCAYFNYQVWQCETCPTGSYLLHSSGIFCYLSISGCLIYELSGCLQCQQGYFLNASLCQSGITTNLYFQLIPSTYYLTSFAKTTLSICLNINQNFNTTIDTCNNYNTTINYCVNATNSTCFECIPTYYISSQGSCLPCSTYENCLTCDQYNCKQCLPSYYLAVDLGYNLINSFFSSSNVSKSSIAQCLSCSIYGCLLCRNHFSDNNIDDIRCDKCLFGYLLYNNTCFLCSDGQYFNITSKSCQKCSITNCQYCNTNASLCQQCLPTYFFNSTSLTCTSLTSFYNTPALDSANFYQILNKSLPYSSTYIINNQILLITSCSDKSNGYVCFCSNTSTTVYSSLCYPINSNLTTAPLATSLINFNSTILTKSAFVSNINNLLLLSQLPNYSFSYSPATGDLLSPNQFATYLQITTNYIRNHYANASSQAAAIANFALSSMNNVFNPFNSTIFAGPGYYFKYLPSTAQAEDSSFVSVTQSSPVQSVAVLVLFNNTYNAATITGGVYVFLGSMTASSNVTLKIKKVGFLGSNQNYQVFANSIPQSLTVSSDSNGFLTLSNVATSTTTSQYAYVVMSSSATSVGDIYASQRIENLIYRDSFIYILVIFTLYFIFVPMCFLVDFVDNKAFKRKVAKSQIDSYQGIKNKTESDNVDDEHIEKLFINYKDFFPIYNIANTEKPKRIAKLCLFIVNIQHSITILCLIYFHLAANQPLVAVLLAIPAYICTIIMGYLCGALTIKLPGNLKYLINILTLAYWIIWIVVMANFISLEYKPYVYTFVIIFFFLDLLFDFLETLLMYFTIKQDTRQVRLFKALSKWFSFRGYYQFDEMAKDLAEARDNQ